MLGKQIVDPEETFEYSSSIGAKMRKDIMFYIKGFQEPSAYME